MWWVFPPCGARAMSKRRNGAGKLALFTAIFRHTTKSAAWKALSVGAKSTYVALQSLHNDRAQNAVFISARDAVEVHGLGSYKEAVGLWFKELEHYGFIVMVQGAHLGAEGKGKSATYRLTDRYHAGKPPTYDFQSWDGVLFDPPKRIDTRGTARLTALQKQNPVCNPQTPRLTPTDIRTEPNIVENGNKCLTPTDIRKDSDCLTPTDIASLPSTGPSSPPPKPPWTTPVLTELQWNNDWAKLYATEFHRPVGLAA
jgi:hypothetical protein